MNEKIVEIIAEILDGLKKKLTLEEVSIILSQNKNLNKQDVSAAMSFICDRRAENYKRNILFSGSELNFRVLSEKEKDHIGIENYNYLLYLMNIGLLNLNDLNFLIEQLAFFPEESLSKKEINWLVLFMLMDFKNNLPPGSRSLLYSSDTIN